MLSTEHQKLLGGCCHDPSLDDDKAPATTPAATPAATSAATSTAKLSTVAIGKHDLSFEAHSIQDLDALADAGLLRGVQGEGGETRQRNEVNVGSWVAIG